MKSPIPDNETLRLAALKSYDILDTPPEEIFDRITRLAATYLNVPIALVSLVDENRQWFKSKVGLNVDETSRELAFCAHTIMNDSLLEIPDANLDKRFADSPLVNGDPHIAFYAGMPIKSSDGFNLGTLCAIDHIPRTLTNEQRLVMSDLADMVVDAIELRRTTIAVIDQSLTHQASNISLQADINVFSQLFHNLPDSIVAFDQLGLIDSLNRGALELFGYDTNEAVGKHIGELFTNDDCDQLKQLFPGEPTATPPDHLAISNHLIGQRRDGSEFPLEMKTLAVQLDRGTIFLAIIENTIHRDLADKALDNFKTALDLTENFIFIFQPYSLKFDYVNQGAIKHTGYSSNELLNKTLSDIDAQKSHEDIKKMLTGIIERHQSDITYETTHRDINGKLISVQVAIHVEMEGGNIKHCVAIGTDITERNCNNQAILDNQARLHAIVDTAVDGIITISERGLIETSNRAAEDLFGYHKSELIGQNVKMLMPSHYASEHDGYLDNYKRTGVAKIIGIGREVTGKRKDGTEFPMELSVAQVKLGGSKLYTGIVRDITERKKYEEDIVEAMAVAENANKAKSDFLSRMSHELRTPLNAIVGFGEILQMETMEAVQHEYVEHISKASTHLSALINEVLEIARIESGQQNLSIEPVSVKDLVSESWGLMRPMAIDRNISFTTNCTDSHQYHVKADLQRLKQVLLNLLSNAVKYNSKGGAIKLICSQGVKEGSLRISVTDTGEGIAAEHHDKVFEVFERLNADQGQEEGSGVGLALSKALMKAMDGEIGLESEQGKGSTFWLELPVGQAQESLLLVQDEELARLAATPISESKIFQLLYIEDNLSNMRLVEALLARRADIELIPAMQGNIGIELATKHRPDLILLDIHLPDIQGDEVLRKLRSIPQTVDIPVIILSADATRSQIDKLLSQGADAYITKPLNIREFLVTLDRLLNK